MREGHALLRRILEHVRAQAPDGVVVFDLDSTLLDNRPRQARIFRDFAEQHDVPELLHARPDHWKGWDLRVPLRNLGLPEPRVQDIYPKLKEFWKAHFFTSEYCVDDVPVPGASDYVARLSEAGAQVVYLTGRHEGMRAGTVHVLDTHHFPLPGADGQPVYLFMKPSLDESDDTFKAATHARVRVLGPVIAAFDNEPMHANDLLKSFPDAIVVHLDTDHSGRQVELAAGIASIPDFRLE